jgi:hypothetical protein
MPDNTAEKRAARTGRTIIILVVLVSGVAGLIVTNLTVNQTLFPVVGQSVNQYATHTQPVVTFNATTPEFGTNAVWLFIVAMALLWSVLLFNRHLQKA